ncbi:MAG: type II toxin-antitoxin system RelE/ParE family toxin [Chitinophagales bacterium]
MVQIKWLKTAKRDLKEIHDYISIDSKRLARLQVERIKDKTTLLKSHIGLGKIVEEVRIPEVREIIEGNYRIIYKIIHPKEIHILMVHHSARDLSKRV